MHFRTGKSGARRFSKKRKATQSQDVTIGAHTVHMPARPYLGIDDDDTKEIVKTAEDWIAGEGVRQ